MQLQTVIATLEELSQYLSVDASYRFVVAVDEAARILTNLECFRKGLEGMKDVR